MTLLLLTGVSGPLVDTFFLGGWLNRREIVATKAVRQIFGHGAKLAYFGAIVDGYGGRTLRSREHQGWVTRAALGRHLPQDMVAGATAIAAKANLTGTATPAGSASIDPLLGVVAIGASMLGTSLASPARSDDGRVIPVLG